jgi:hypothetical protein
MTEAFEADLDAVTEECVSELLCNGAVIRGMAGEQRYGGSPDPMGIMPDRAREFVSSASQYIGALPKKGDLLALDGETLQVSSVETSSDGAQVRIQFEAVGS